MPRMIDADALKNYIDCGHLRSPIEVCLSELDVVRMLDRMPTLDVEPVRHGRWVGDSMDFACSVCGKYQNMYTGKTNYCPNCGAKMRGDTDETE